MYHKNMVCVRNFPHAEVSIKVGVMEFGLYGASPAGCRGVHLRFVSGWCRVGPSQWSTDGTVTQGALHSTAGRTHLLSQPRAAQSRSDDVQTVFSHLYLSNDRPYGTLVVCLSSVVCM